MERSVLIRRTFSLGVICVIMACVIQCMSLTFAMNKDISGYLQRANSATTAGNLAYLIDMTITGLDEWEMYEGSWAMIDKNPGNEMEYARTQLTELRDRALQIEANYDQGSMDYAMSLNEIKGTLSRIKVDPYDWYTLRYAFHLYPLMLILYFFIGMLMTILIVI